MTRKIYALDSETDPFKEGRIPQPFLWGLYDGDIYEEFTSAAGLVEFLFSQRAVVYAHNGGRFDFHYLREYINTDELIMLIGGRIAKFRIGECEFRDSMNLFTFPLSAYQKETIDYSIMEADVRDDPNNRAIISSYLRSDCVNLYNLVTSFFKDYGRSLTQAGAAMRKWSRMSNTQPPKQTATQYEKFKPFYYGGRVQCFKRGVADCNFTVIDMRSAYPYAMLSAHPFSTDAQRLDTLPDAGEWGRYFIRFRGISRGALPIIEGTGANRKLIFPNDELVRDYAVTGWELEAARESESVEIIQVLESWRFPMTMDFRDYVNHFYALRTQAKLEGNKSQDLFAKIFLNALYGKFGANPDNYREYMLSHDETLHEYLAQGWSENTKWGARTLIQRALPEAKQRFYNIATAASITGFVRAHLWRAINKCEGVIYCDTDSIAAESTQQLNISGALGDWKEEMRCDRYAVCGKKLYSFRATDGTTKTASKGARLSSAEIESIAQGNTVTYRPQVPTYSAHRPAPRFINREIRRT
jgi:hypothetical protein